MSDWIRSRKFSSGFFMHASLCHTMAEIMSRFPCIAGVEMVQPNQLKSCHSIINVLKSSTVMSLTIIEFISNLLDLSWVGASIKSQLKQLHWIRWYREDSWVDECNWRMYPADSKLILKINSLTVAESHSAVWKIISYLNSQVDSKLVTGI